MWPALPLTWRTSMFRTGRRDVIVRCQLWLGGLLAIKPCQSAQLIWIYSYKVHITSTYRSYKAALHCGLRVQQLISARTAHEEHSSQLRESQDKVQAAFWAGLQQASEQLPCWSPSAALQAMAGFWVVLAQCSHDQCTQKIEQHTKLLLCAEQRECLLCLRGDGAYQRCLHELQ